MEVFKKIGQVSKGAVVALSAAAVLALAPAAKADLISNGSFESSTNGAGQLGYNTTATGWTTSGATTSYTFLFSPSTATGVGSAGIYGNVQLPSGVTASPDGGNFVGQDGVAQLSPLSQTVNGLVVGNLYVLDFYWGGTEQTHNADEPTSEGWQVSLGSQTQSTSILSVPTLGFSGWQQASMAFTATSSSEVLSFLAEGSPTGAPPFSLLDGVSLNPAPEPATYTMMLGGLLAGAGLWRRKKQAK
jgi:hypothetical protein